MYLWDYSSKTKLYGRDSSLIHVVQYQMLQDFCSNTRSIAG